MRSLNHAREYTDITEEEIDIILASRKSVLSDSRRSWVKSHVDNFDVPVGAYDSTQVADLVGIYILDTLGRMVNLEQVKLYNDDGIIYIPDSNGPKTFSIQKKIIRTFELLGLRIQIASNLKIVDFLDVTLNLSNGTFKPFSKNDSAPRYKKFPRITQDRCWDRSPMRWIKKLISCPHVRKFSRKTRVDMMTPWRTVDSRVDWNI